MFPSMLISPGKRWEIQRKKLTVYDVAFNPSEDCPAAIDGCDDSTDTFLQQTRRFKCLAWRFSLLSQRCFTRAVPQKGFLEISTTFLWPVDLYCALPHTSKRILTICLYQVEPVMRCTSKERDPYSILRAMSAGLRVIGLNHISRKVCVLNFVMEMSTLFPSSFWE